MKFSDDNERITEQDIIRAFGSSIIEFEAVLYQKFLIISAAHSLVSEKAFKKLLNDMHAKGYISPTLFNNKRCWRREIVLEDLENSEITPAEFEDVFRERDIIATSSGSSPVVKESIVSDSSSVAERIKKTMRTKLFSDQPLDAKANQDIKAHAAHMRKALSNSHEEFTDYLRDNIPSILKPMEEILQEKGENVVLLGLRIVSTS